MIGLGLEKVVGGLSQGSCRASLEWTQVAGALKAFDDGKRPGIASSFQLNITSKTKGVFVCQIISPIQWLITSLGDGPQSKSSDKTIKKCIFWKREKLFSATNKVLTKQLPRV